MSSAPRCSTVITTILVLGEKLQIKLFNVYTRFSTRVRVTRFLPEAVLPPHAFPSTSPQGETLRKFGSDCDYVIANAERIHLGD